MWSAINLVTDQDLGAIEPQAIAAAQPWGKTAWPEARAEAKRELKILVELAFPDIRNAADRILDLHRPDWVFSYDGSSAYTDVTTAAVDPLEDDLDLATIFSSTSKRLYIGADYQFDGLWVLLKDAISAITATLAIKYRGATGWIAVPNAADGTAVGGKTFAESGRITWPAIPGDWQRVKLGTTTADPFFYVELSVDNALSGTITASQLVTVRAPDGLKRIATLLALSYVLNGLERQAGKPKDWQDKAAYYRESALSLFELLKANGGIPVDVNRDNVVQTTELRTIQPVRLRRA